MKIAELICDLNCGHILAEHFVEYIFLVITENIYIAICSTNRTKLQVANSVS